MIGWAVVIVLLLIVACLPAFLGLLVVLPMLGHATWHTFIAGSCRESRKPLWERRLPFAFGQRRWEHGKSAAGECVMRAKPERPHFARGTPMRVAGLKSVPVFAVKSRALGAPRCGPRSKVFLMEAYVFV